ncbi:SusC/RagA family TonB-linked outer membrane protein [Christiangramia crocea]|uniref:TonB-dependent receptor n=1 Tax=Christiangramia crocea TaxID=2904124 RepID=A0A9X2A8J6_9FLAO|nr:TonB-dependent receptor [Gramella crocea]MCG9972542.1 TonB-dependent receptor [Gramella crocea]
MIFNKNILSLLLLFGFNLTVFAQEIIIGKVVDENNIPLMGVNVIVEGTNIGSITDFDGSFSIEVPSEEDILIFSMVGMETKEVEVLGQKTINVTLNYDVAGLDEIVLIGYGASQKRDLTGAISSVGSEELNVAPTANFDQALVGRIAGVNITSSEGTPGGPLNIVIRGGNSITGDNSPLYVVDGIPLENFDPATMNTNDIKTIDILKDASATAIYGSRGANGVVLITTKNGNSDGTTDISVSLDNGMQFIPNKLDVLSPYEYVKYQQLQAFALDNWASGSSTQQFLNRWGDPELYRTVNGTDWQEEVFQEALITQSNVSVSGGNSKTNFYLSGEYVDQEGTLINTGFEKINNRLKLNHNFNKKTSIATNLFYSNAKRIGPRLRASKQFQTFKNVLRFRPVEPIVDDGLEVGGYDPLSNDFNDTYNPVDNLTNTDRNNTQHLFGANFTLIHKFNKNFELNSSANYRIKKSEENTFFGSNTGRAERSDTGITAIIENFEDVVLSASNTLTYTKKTNNNSFTALIGTEASENSISANSLENNNIPTDEFGISNIGIATTPTIALSNSSTNRLLSFFSRVNYSFDKRYILTASFRSDGSSKFPKQNRWGYFPSFSAAWRMSNEKFLKKIKWISNLKIRGGYGVTGNNRINDFAAYNTFGVSPFNNYVFGNNEEYQPGATQNNLAVPNLKWETTKQSNFGLDFSLFKWRFTGTLDYYNKKTTDLLLNADMALSTGFNRVSQNVGTVSNEGFELTLNSTIISKDEFDWNTSFNISTNKNKILKLNDGQIDIKTDANYDYNDEYHYISKIGKPVGMMYGLQFDRLYQAEDFIYHPEKPQGSQYELKEGIPNNGRIGVGPGHPKYIDQNGDGTIDAKDRVIIGNPHPKHYGGFENHFKLKNFDVRFLFQWSYDFDVFNANRVAFGMPRVDKGYSGLADIADAWSPTNTDTNVATTYSNGHSALAPSGNKLDDRFIEDGSYLKLKTVSIGYSLPKDFLKRMELKDLRFSLSGQNLYTWTEYSGFDPDVSISGNPLIQNLDFSAYPQSTTITLGVSAKF